MNLNTDYSSLWGMASSAIQQNLPDNFNMLNQWKDLDFTCPEVIKDLATNENCAMILSLLKMAGCVSEEQVKLINVISGIYKNEEWENWDLSDPKTIKKLAENPDHDLIIAAMQTVGFLSVTQIRSLKSKVELVLKVPQLIRAFNKDLEKLQNVSKLEIFTLGERKINAANSNSRWDIAASVGGVAIAAVAGTVFAGAAFAFLGQPVAYYMKSRAAAVALSISGLSFGFILSQTDKIYRYVENCMIEGYYLKTKELAQKHFQATLGDEAVEFILSNVNSNGQLDNIGNKGFRKLVDMYLNS